MVDIESNEQFGSEISRDDRVTIALFKADWCGDCHYIEPFIGRVEGGYSNLDILNIDIEKTPTIAKEYQVVGIPSFVAFKNGEIIGSFISRQRKSESEIRSFFESVIKESSLTQ